MRARSSPSASGRRRAILTHRPGVRRDRGPHARPGGMIGVPWCIACGPSRSRSSPPRRSPRSRRPRSRGAAPPRPAASLNGARSVLVISLPATAWIDLRGARPAEPHPAAPPQRGRRPRDPHRAQPHPARRGLHGVRCRRPLGRRNRPTRRSTSSATERYAGHQRRRGVPDPHRHRPRDRRSARSAGRSSPCRTTRSRTTPRSARWAPRSTAPASAGSPSRTRTRRPRPGRCCTARPRSRSWTTPDASPARSTDLLQRRAATRRSASELDIDAVDRAFPTDFTTRRQVVLVEASDLARADEYRALATPEQRAVLHAAALQRTDELVGRLLAPRRPAPGRGHGGLAVPQRPRPAP